MKLVEPTPVHDEFVTGLSHIEILTGGNVRFVLYSTHTDEAGEEYYILEKKIVMALDSVPDAIAKAMAVVTGAAFGRLTKFLPRYH